MSGTELWQRYQEYRFTDETIGFALDISRVRFPADYFARMEPAMQKAYTAMAALEAGAIANPDENRMVGHYWLRDAELAPNAALRAEVSEALAAVKGFAAKVLSAGKIQHVIHIGIGGSALGPQFIAQALAKVDAPVKMHFIDNTDPEGIENILASLKGKLPETLVVVVSKSGSTPEPNNGMREVEAAFRAAGVPFAPNAVAVTMAGSHLHKYAQANQWSAMIPMQDWVGGRTSVMSAVGLLPAALLGIDIDAFLAGAAAMDELTRKPTTRSNPAALLALMWYYLGDGKGRKDMVILPYKDRLVLFSKYLQQLVMESLGKELDRKQQVVHQGIAVYGNKGSTDQHAYIQQLRDGVANFFATFIQVRKDRAGAALEVEPGVTAGDYLFGFLLGTRRALYENGRDSITITINEVTPHSVGALIALYERAVGLYAELIDINAYHQPGVEAGKKAAAEVLKLQAKVVSTLKSANTALSVDEIASTIGAPDEAETIYLILDHLAHNDAKVKKIADFKFQIVN